MAGATTRIFRWARWFVTGFLLLMGLLVVAMAIHLFAAGVVGNVQDWNRWLEQHRFQLLAWRLILYAGTTVGWYRMRKRLLNREPGAYARTRFLRSELAAVAVILVLESALWFRAW